MAIAVTAADGTALATRLTNRSGEIVPIEGSDWSLLQLFPDPAERPYTQVNLFARLEGFEQIEIEGLQIFSGIVTDQNLEMIPLPELPDSWSRAEIFDTGTQNL